MQTARNHQVQHGPEVVVYADGDTFANAANSPHGVTFESIGGRIYGTQQERAGDADAFERLADDAGFESFDIDRDVRQLGHGRAPSDWGAGQAADAGCGAGPCLVRYAA